MTGTSVRIVIAGMLWGLAFSGGAQGFTCQSNGNGNWNAAGTWTTCGGGIPGAGDDVQIRLAHVITIPAGFGAMANSVTFTASNGAARLDHAANTSTLTVGAGGVTINPTGGGNVTRAWNIDAGSATVNGSLSMSGGGNPNRIVLIRITTGSLDVNGNLTMTAASAGRAVIDMSGGAGNLFLAGSFSLDSGNGTLVPGTTSTVTYDSATTPVTVATGSAIDYNHLVIAKGAGNVANAATTGNLTVTGNLAVAPGAFNIPGITANIAGTTRVTGSLGFITAATGTKTFTGDVTIDSGGAWTNNINVPITLRGNFINNGSFTSGLGTYTFNGSVAQNITGTSGGTTTFASATLTNGNGLSLTGTHDVTVTTLLTLTSGRITTNANILTISNGSNISGVGAGNFINGNLRKTVGTGGCTACNFEIGSEAGGIRYTPVTNVTFAGITASGTVTASTTAAAHPGISTSGLDETLDVNRYWTLVNSGVALTGYSATFTWVAADLDTGADTTVFESARFDPPAPAAGNWSATTTGTRTITSIQVTGVTGFGDFAVGQPLAVAIGIGRFNAYDTTTSAGSISGFVTTKVAGTAFNADIIAIRANRQNIDTNFTGEVLVELLNASDNSGAADASTGCRASWAAIQVISPNPVFIGADNGRKTITVNQPNAWREARLRISNLSGTLVGCSTDAFAIRPASIAVSAADATWEMAGTARALDNTAATGGNVHKAGQPFTITVMPAPASATNYDGSPGVSAVACTLPASCVDGTLDIGAFGGGGTRISNAATYSEAGAFNLTLVDQDFAIIDATDGTPADCSASGRFVCQSPAPVAVGRFVPDRFEFTGPSTPQLLTFGDATCGSRSFTYVGQPFWYASGGLPFATLNAVNAAGTVTQNYPLGTALARPVIGEAYADNSAPAAAPLDTASVGTPQPASGAGTGSYMASLTGRLSFIRSTTTPVGPFNAAISLTVTATDTTESAVIGNGMIGTPSPLVFNGGGTGIAFDSGSEVRYGRLRVTNASGSQLVPLRVMLETQHYSGAPANAFITNTADSCTSIAANNIELGDYTSNLTACETSLTVGGFNAGRSTALLSAPGPLNSGSVRITPRLEAAVAGPATCIGGASTPVSGANRLYLQGNWTTPGFDRNPSAQATFGVYRGPEEVIFIRENF
jgi:MSHA biogenesis protein MshQ